MFMREECIYNTVCGQEICPQSCVRWDEMKYLLDTSKIPKTKQRFNVLIPDTCDENAYENLASIRDDIVNFVNGGNNLYICSEVCGNGKTTWSIKLLLQYFNEVWAGNCFRTRGLFINVNTFLFRLKDSFTKYDEEIEEMKRLISEVDLVVWDDVASNKMSRYDSDLILSLVDSRIADGKANIFTSNILPSNLEGCVGSRLKSRICGENTIKIQFFGGDRR